MQTFSSPLPLSKFCLELLHGQQYARLDVLDEQLLTLGRVLHHHLQSRPPSIVGRLVSHQAPGDGDGGVPRQVAHLLDDGNVGPVVGGGGVLRRGGVQEALLERPLTPVGGIPLIPGGARLVPRRAHRPPSSRRSGRGGNGRIRDDAPASAGCSRVASCPTPSAPG